MRTHLLFFVFGISVPAVLAADARRPQSAPALGEPPLLMQRVTCETEDEVKVAGTYCPVRAKAGGPKVPVVVLVHDYNVDRTSWEPLIAPLHDAGFAVLAIDLRGHGETKGPDGMQLPERAGRRDTRLFRQMYKDVLGAYDWLTTRADVDLSRYLVVGAGLGSSVALDCAAHDRSIDGVVCLCPEVALLGVDSLADAAKYGPRPLLLLPTPAERAAADQLAKLAPTATLKPVGAVAPGETPREMKGTAMLGKIPGLEKMIIEFLLKAAGPAPAELVVASTNSDVYHSPDAPMVQKIKPKNLRRFSSPAEAEARGLRASRARGDRLASDKPAREQPARSRNRQTADRPRTE